jgi:hypothetical protein
MLDDRLACQQRVPWHAVEGSEIAETQASGVVGNGKRLGRLANPAGGEANHRTCLPG